MFFASYPFHCTWTLPWFLGHGPPRLTSPTRTTHLWHAGMEDCRLARWAKQKYVSFSYDTKYCIILPCVFLCISYHSYIPVTIGSSWTVTRQFIPFSWSHPRGNCLPASLENVAEKRIKWFHETSVKAILTNYRSGTSDKVHRCLFVKFTWFRRSFWCSQ